MEKKQKVFFGVLWGTAFAVMLVLFLSHIYNDVIITTRHGINFWRILADGDFINFYEVNRVASGNTVYTDVQRCSYNILVYIVFAIWNIPLAIIEAVSGVDIMNNVFCLAYAKFLPVMAMLLSAFLVHRILLHLGVEKQMRYILSYLYLTSSLLISVIFIMSQYDILSVVLQLLGLLAFLKKDNRKFLLWFGIAFCFKFFSLILFLPLMLLRNKKILQWLKALTLMIVPLIITKIPFLFASGNLSMRAEAMAFSLGGSLLQHSEAYVNVFVVIYLGILVWSYLQNDSGKEQFCAIWAAFLSYAAFFCFLEAYPYWAVFMAPFIPLLLAFVPQHLYIGVFLETVGFAALMLKNMISYKWCFFGKTMCSMLMSRIVSESALSFEGSLIYRLVEALQSIDWFVPVTNSVFIAAMFALAVLAYPNRTKQPTRGCLLTGCYDVLIVRCVIVCGLCLMPVLSLFI